LETRYEELVEYKRSHGDCNVSKSYKANPQLGVWAVNQRTNYKRLVRGEQSSLSEERKKKLEDIGFVWEVFVAWETRYEELVEYKRSHGDCKVPSKYNANPQLGLWVNRQRTLYKRLVRGEQSSLSEERRKKLDDIEFLLKVFVGVPWETRYEELVEYKRLHGACNVPKLYKANPQLGTWVMKQRTLYNRLLRGEQSSLSEERRKKLDGIRFVWKVPVGVPAWEAGVPAWEAGVPTWKT